MAWRIVEHLSVAELEQRYRTAQDATEARHTQAIWLLTQGRTVLDVASVLAFAPRWVEELAARYNAHGPDALGDQRRRNGRAASVLTEAVLAALAERLRTPPEDGGRWTGAKVAIWMAKQLGLAKVHPQRGWEALNRVRWSVQAPRPRHPRAATPEQRAKFKGGSTRSSRVPGQRTPASRSRSGPRTSIVSG
jgi:transposase